MAIPSKRVSIARRTWLKNTAAILGSVGLMPLSGCSSEPFAHYEAIAFSAPAQLALWGLDPDAGNALAKRLWKRLNQLDTELLQAHLTPEVDFQMRGAALDEAASVLHHPDLSGALLSIGEHILALGERGFRPWHVGIPNPLNLKPLLSFDLFADERLITLGQYANYRLKEGDAISPRALVTEQGECASCSIILRGSGGARLAKNVIELYASSQSNWPSLAKQLGLDTVLWISHEGQFEATQNFAKRSLMTDARDRLKTI